MESLRARSGDLAVPWLLGIIAFVLLIWGLKATASVTMPAAFGIFLIVLLWPLHRALRRRMPDWVSIVLLVLLLLLLLGGLLLAIAYSADQLIARVQDYGARIDALTAQTSHLLERFGVAVQDPWAAFGTTLRDFVLRAAGVLLRDLTSFFGGLFLVLAYVALGLLDSAAMARRLGISFDHERAERIRATIGRIADRFRRYVLVQTGVSLLLGLSTYLYCWAFGQDLAFLWGLLAFLLNFLPIVGSVVAVAVPALFALFQFGGIMKPLAILAGLTVIQIVEGNYVDPHLLGRSLALSSFLVLFGVAFWGWVWGIPGALLGVPITVALLMACGEFAATRWLRDLLSPEREGA